MTHTLMMKETHLWTILQIRLEVGEISSHLEEYQEEGRASSPGVQVEEGGTGKIWYLRR